MITLLISHCTYLLTPLLDRRTLATTPYLVNHIPTPPKIQTVPMTNPISSLTESLPPTPLHNACTHHFLHPLSWMRPTLEQGLLDGRLECPNLKCKAQLGRYAWQGMKCSCGVWVCPAFSLQKGRVDEMLIKGDQRPEQGNDRTGAAADAKVDPSRGSGIRLPPGMKGKQNL